MVRELELPPWVLVSMVETGFLHISFCRVIPDGNVFFALLSFSFLSLLTTEDPGFPPFLTSTDLGVKLSWEFSLRFIPPSDGAKANMGFPLSSALFRPFRSSLPPSSCEVLVVPGFPSLDPSPFVYSLSWSEPRFSFPVT
jgi:hypothetical protein